MNADQLIEARTERTRWFMRDRFGMFIHWGLYAIPARGEWVRNREEMTVDEYQTYFDEFNPTAYDPRAWARAAREAGMKYAVMTAKHHDGFCLFDSKLTDYTSARSKAGRDLVAEFLDAFRAEGLKVGLYYSLLDWHHEDYPAYGDEIHPMRNNKQYARNPERFGSYVAYMHGQVRELLTGYGKLDMMWFDFSYGDNMKGETWEASALVALIRSLQPHVIIDNRLEGNGAGGSIFTRSPLPYAGDFASPEQLIPPAGEVDEAGKPVPWEACITLNNNWGYAAADRSWKSAETVIRKLVECVSKNGNLLLNIGPDALGRIPDASLKILQEVGGWMRLNGDSIYGCAQAAFPKPEWGRYTQSGRTLYAHIFEQGVGAYNLSGLAGRVRKARLLCDGSEICITRPWNAERYKNDLFFNFARPESDTYPLPDDRDTVVAFELNDDD